LAYESSSRAWVQIPRDRDALAHACGRKDGLAKFPIYG
jgi:hypothetical protein